MYIVLLYACIGGGVGSFGSCVRRTKYSIKPTATLCRGITPRRSSLWVGLLS